MNLALLVWKSTDLTWSTITKLVNTRSLGAYQASLPTGLPQSSSAGA